MKGFSPAYKRHHIDLLMSGHSLGTGEIIPNNDKVRIFWMPVWELRFGFGSFKWNYKLLFSLQIQPYGREGLYIIHTDFIESSMLGSVNR